MFEALNLPKPQSTFVSVIAWLGIISGAFSALACSVIVLPTPSISGGVWLLSAIATLSTSIGLRQRREWARRGFIAVLCYSVLMSFIGALTLHVSAAPAPAAGAPPAMTPEQLEAAVPAIRTTLLVGATIGALFNAAIVAKLCTVRIREEFGAEPAA